MIRKSLNLPKGLRLDLRLVKVRKSPDDTHPLPSLRGILRIRRGSKVSRFFRHFFEHNKIKKFLGTNLVLLTIASSFVSPSRPFAEKIQEVSLTQAPIVFTTESGTKYPLKHIKITQGYKFYHPGIDMDGETGDKVYPIMAGKVIAIEYSRFGYGNSVLINHGGSTVSLYAHLSKINVSEDEIVANSTNIGNVGTTGRSFGDHLHLEIYENGKTINPISLISQ